MDYDERNSFQVEGIKAVPKRIVKGIPCFDDSSYFYAHASRESLLNAAILANTIGWKKAILEGVEPSLSNYVTNPKRTFFLTILEIIVFIKTY
jgi:hypothetical protein